MIFGLIFSKRVRSGISVTPNIAKCGWETQSTEAEARGTWKIGNDTDFSKTPTWKGTSKRSHWKKAKEVLEDSAWQKDTKIRGRTLLEQNPRPCPRRGNREIKAGFVPAAMTE